jgi:hypothetical protein
MLDGETTTLEDAQEISTEYFRSACVVNLNGVDSLRGSNAEINQNAIFDAARRFSQHVRFIPRAQFTGYAVKNGRSILWFRRRRAVGGFGVEHDFFEGIAGKIAHQAPAYGFTNEWLLEVDLKPGNTGEGNRWNPAVFADRYPIFNRAHFYSPEIANDPALVWHVGYGMRDSGLYGGVIVPESPSGWNFAHLSQAWTGHWHVNQAACAGEPVCEENYRNFCKSAPVYKPPVEIQSVETFTYDGVEYARVTLAGRLQNTCGEAAGAPQSISNDITTWDGPTIAAEPYRTDENGLRLYLLHEANGYNANWTVGDRAWNATPPDLPGPCIYPTFFLTHLVPEPYPGQGTPPRSPRTPLWHETMAQAEVYLRAMCEGFVDRASTIELAQCAQDPTSGICWPAGGQGLFDFTFESLCNAAFADLYPLETTAGASWFNTLPRHGIARAPAKQTRPDNPQGFGPLPRVIHAAEIFNQFAAAVNLLTTARLELPLALESRYAEAYMSYEVIPQWSSGRQAYHEGICPQPVPDLNTVAWTDGLDGAQGSADSFIAPSDSLAPCGTVASDWGWCAGMGHGEWRIKPQQDILLALPAAWRGQIASVYGMLGCLCKHTVLPVITGLWGWRCGGEMTCQSGVDWNSTPGAPLVNTDASDCHTLGSQSVNETTAFFASQGLVTPPPLPWAIHLYMELGATQCVEGPSSVAYVVQADSNVIFGYLRVPTLAQ